MGRRDEESGRRRTKADKSKERREKFGNYSQKHLRIRQEAASNRAENEGKEAGGARKLRS